MEKRYGLFNPDRQSRNVRVYNLNDLRKMLNISLLYKNEFKISKLAKLSEKELIQEVRKVALNAISNNYEINSLIISMYTFDTNLFEEIYLTLIEKQSFEQIFKETYLPLLNHIGVLWQTETIMPTHEHFISNLIYQKIALNTALIDNIKTSNDHVFVLFLPKGEIHELGLLYLNYYLLHLGFKTIYLGRDIPFDNLSHINSQFKKITWISYFLIDKSDEDKSAFLLYVDDLLRHTKNDCLIFGDIWAELSSQNENKEIKFYRRINDFIED